MERKAVKHTRDRVQDENFKRQLDANRIYICEKHFYPDQLYIYPSRKYMKEGVIPSLNLPVKSIQSKKVLERSTSSTSKRETSKAMQIPPPTMAPDCSQNFEELLQRVKCLKLNEWTLKVGDNYFEVIENFNNEFVIPKYQVFADNTLEFHIRVFGWMLPFSHDIYNTYEKSLRNVTVSTLLKTVVSYKICAGIDSAEVNQSINIDRHIVPKCFDFKEFKTTNNPVHQVEYLRSKLCVVLLRNGEDNICRSCNDLRMKTQITNRKKECKLTSPAHPNAPVTLTSPNCLKLAMQQQRSITKNQQLEYSQLSAKLEEMKEELVNSSRQVSTEIGNDLIDIFKGIPEEKVPPFMRLFWEEQQKYLRTSSSSQIRYHPMVIKFCLAFAAKSPSTYRDLRLDGKTGAGVLVLPSERTLRDYRNYIRPQRGFKPRVINDLAEKTKNFSTKEKFVVLLLDEMKVQEDLVWDKSTGVLIGFDDLGDVATNYATLQNVSTLASHVLVFLLKSVVNPLSFSLATFATNGVSSFQLFPLFWKAVAITELSCNMKLVACTFDGASSNRKFVKLHQQINSEEIGSYVYRVKNVYAEEDRYIWFMSDTPHLMKTARNCLRKSGSTHRMWNNGMELLWSHISNLYYENLDYGLSLVPKLTNNHINLTPYSVMNVRLAVQVLSESVGKVLQEFGPPDAAATAKFAFNLINSLTAST